MLNVNLSRNAAKFLRKLPQKHSFQIAVKIRSLQENPYPSDYKQLKGNLGQYYRIDSGEYRVIYEILGDILYIILIGKRNDDEVYR